MASTSSTVIDVITPEDVLESLMNDGTIDAIRLKVITQLKANEELKNNIITMVEHSNVLNTPGAEKQTKRELFDALREELEIPALEKASKSIWESILDNDGVGKEINETVERVFCRLSGREPPLFPPPNSEVQQNQVKEKERSGNENESGHLDSSSQKRNFSELSVQIEGDEAVDGSGDPPSEAVDSVPDSRAVAADCGNNTEEEPWRCKRTDGKKWRCSNNCLPDERYCERHISLVKKNKIQVEIIDQGTASKKMVESSSKKSRKKVESTNQVKRGRPKKQVEDPIRVDQPRKMGVSSCKKDRKPKKQVKSTKQKDTPDTSCTRERKPVKQLESRVGVSSSNNMVESSTTICSSSAPSHVVMSNTSNSGSHGVGDVSVGVGLGSSPTSALKSDTCEREPSL